MNIGDELSIEFKAKGLGQTLKSEYGWQYSRNLVQFNGQVLAVMAQDTHFTVLPDGFLEADCYLRGQCVGILDDGRVLIKVGGQIVLARADEVNVLDQSRFGQSLSSEVLS